MSVKISPRRSFWPCQHIFFCQSCAETHFECEKTGRERCLCGELIEGIRTMETTDEENEATPHLCKVWSADMPSVHEIDPVVALPSTFSYNQK